MFTNQKEVRDTILQDKSVESQSQKQTGKKIYIIILVTLCIIILIGGIVLLALYLFQSQEKEKTKDQEINITIEVFKYRKGRGEKEHEKPNLGEQVYFISEEFNYDFSDFEMYLNGEKMEFTKNMTFNEEGNYTATYKFRNEFESFSKLFYNCYYITEINFTNINHDRLKDLNSMFYNCDGLYDLNLDGFYTGNVKDTSYMFLG